MISKSSVQHEVAPPTGLQNNQTDTAAVPWVAKHDACSNGRRISKQTGPCCRDRCSRSESGLTGPDDLHIAPDTTTDRAEDPQEADRWRQAGAQVTDSVLYLSHLVSGEALLGYNRSRLNVHEHYLVVTCCCCQ